MKKQVKAGKVVKPVKAWSIIKGGRIQANWTTSVRRRAESDAAVLFGPLCEVVPVLIVPDDGSYTITPKRAGRKGK